MADRWAEEFQSEEGQWANEGGADFWDKLQKQWESLAKYVSGSKCFFDVIVIVIYSSNKMYH